MGELAGRERLVRGGALQCEARLRQGNGQTKVPGVDFGHSHPGIGGIGLDAVDVSTQIVCSYHLQTICD